MLNEFEFPNGEFMFFTPRATGVELSRLALGVPVGSELNYLDAGTLRQAFQARRAP